MDTKANGVEFEILNHDKVGQEEYEYLVNKISKELGFGEGIGWFEWV